MKSFKRIPDRINTNRRVDLNAVFDGTTLNVTLLIFALDADGKELGVERHSVGDIVDEDDFLGTGNASTFNKVKNIMETIHTRANIEAAP